MKKQKLIKILFLSLLAITLTFISCNIESWVSFKPEPKEEIKPMGEKIPEEKSLNQAIDEAKKAEEAIAKKEAIERLQNDNEAFPPRLIQKSDKRAKTAKPKPERKKRLVDHYEDRQSKGAGCEKIGMTVQYLGEPTRIVGCKDKIGKINGKTVLDALETLVNE